MMLWFPACFPRWREEAKPAPGYEDFRVMRLTDLARDILERGGVKTRGMSQSQLSRKILRPMSLAASTSDFPSIFAAITNKVLQKAYAEAPATWKPWVNIVPVSDFREIHGISLSEAPDLECWMNTASTKPDRSRSMESYRIARYGKNVRLTREMMINDDLRAFLRIPQLFGNASARKVADIVYDLLLSNPKMSDGIPLFDSKHNNLEAVAENKTHVSTATLKAGRKKMRLQKGLRVQSSTCGLASCWFRLNRKPKPKCLSVPQPFQMKTSLPVFITRGPGSSNPSPNPVLMIKTPMPLT